MRSRTAAMVAVSAVVLAAIVALVLVVLVGSGPEPPATGAAQVVPADALAYVHVSIDPSRPAVRQALALAARFPDFPLASAAVQKRLDAIAGNSSSVDFSKEIRPWLGAEAALALLNTPSSTAGSVIVLDVRERTAAQAFLTLSGASADGRYRGTTLLRYGSGTVAAFVSHYLVLGQDASVRVAIDVDSGHTPSLASDSGYRSAAAGEPAGRVLDAYASQAGVRRVLAPQGGVIGALGVLLYQPSLTGVTISVSPASGGARVRVHSALDPKLASLSHSRPASFSPTLQNVLPSQSLLMLDVTGLDKIAPRVLNAGATGGVAGRIGPLLSRLGGALASEGVNVQDIVSIFRGESAVAIGPASGRTPSLIVVARTRNEAATRMALAALEVPLAQLFTPTGSSAGQAPVFNDRQVAGVTVHQLSLATGLEFDYTVNAGLVIIATSLDGMRAVLAPQRPLADDPGYRAALSDRPDRVSSLLFLDFSQLLNLGEQTGLTRSARYTALRPDLQRIRAVGLNSTSGEADSTAELFLQIT